MIFLPWPVNAKPEWKSQHQPLHGYGDGLTNVYLGEVLIAQVQTYTPLNIAEVRHAVRIGAQRTIYSMSATSAITDLIHKLVPTTARIYLTFEFMGAPTVRKWHEIYPEVSRG